MATPVQDQMANLAQASGEVVPEEDQNTPAVTQQDEFAPFRREDGMIVIPVNPKLGKDTRTVSPDVFEKPVTTSDQTTRAFLDKFGPVREGQFSTMTTLEGRPEDRYPALESDAKKRLEEAFKEYAPINVPFTSLQFPGAGSITEYAPKVDWKKVNPDISLADILPLNDDNYRENKFMKFDAIENADGERIRISDLPYDRKLQVANSYGATKFILYDDDAPDGERVIDIPWEESITKFTKFPEGFQAVIDGRMLNTANMTFDEYKRMMLANRLSSTMIASLDDPEITKALQAQYFNQVLMEVGLDARSRYLIINENIKDIGFSEAVRLSEGVGETLVKGFGEFTLYAAGEIYGLAGAVIGANMDGTIADYETRETVADNWWRPLSFEIVDYFANQNVIIPLGVAEDLARVQTGFVPELAQLYAEIVGPSKLQLARMGVVAKDELEKFELFAQAELRKNKELDEQQLIGMFIDKRASDPTFSISTPSGVSLDVTFPGGNLRRKLRESRYEERLVNAFQMTDAAMDVDQRANVVTQAKYIAGLKNRRDALARKAELSGELPDYNAVRQIDQQIVDANTDLTNIARKSSTPKFIRDVKRQDKYILAGAAGGGLVFEHVLDKDSELGQLIGLGIGFGYSMAKGRVSPALHAIRARLSRDDNHRAKIQWAVNRLQKLNPGLQTDIMAHGAKLLAYQDELIAAGIDPKTLEMTLPVVTDIGTLRLFEQQIQRDVQVNGIFTNENVQRVQESLSLQNRLNTELNTILENMKVTTEADQQFYNFIDAVLKENKNNVEFLKSQIETVEKGAVGHYLNALNANTSALNIDSPMNAVSSDDVPTFQQALDNLHNRQLIDYAALPASNLRTELNKTSRVVNRALVLKSNEILRDIGNDKEARKDFRKTNSKNVAANTTSSGIFMMHLEEQYSVARTIAQKPYAYLESDDVKFFAGGQQLADKDLVTDAADVFVSFFSVPTRGPEGMLPIRRRLNETLSPAERKAIDDQMASMAEPFFLQQAATENLSPEKWLGKQVTRFKAQGHSFTGRNKTARVAELILEEITAATDGQGTIPFFEVTPLQLRKIGQVVSNMKYANRENGAVFESLQEIESLVEGKFETFSVGGRPIQNLGVLDPETNEVVSLVKYVEAMNAGYSDFKKTWHDTDVDNSFIAIRLAHGSQKKALLSGDHPTGKTYGNRTINEMLTIDDLTDPVKANKFMLSMGQAMGSAVGTKGFRLVEGADNTVVTQSYVRALVGEHIASSVKSGTMTAKQMGDMARAIENNLVMVTSTGREVPLISVAKVIDDTVGNLELTVPKQMLNKIDKDVATRIDKAVAAGLKPAKAKMQLHEDAVKILENATSESLNFNQIADYIVGGGRNRLEKFKEAMRLGGKTDEEIETVLRDSYLEALSNDMFTETGREIVHRKFDPDTNKNKVTKELQINPVALNARLGTSAEHISMIKEILGEDTYNTWRAVSGFIAEIDNNPLANARLALKGVPRSLSVESYISRFYAINRGVVRPQYVGTEATLQQLRANNFNFLSAVLSDPALGQMFLEVVRTGKPLSDTKQAAFSNALIQAYGQSVAVHGAETTKVVDAAGREFTLTATREQKAATGYVRPDFLEDYYNRTGQEFTGPIYTPSLDVEGVQQGENQ